jgi:hypothetical protein
MLGHRLRVVKIRILINQSINQSGDEKTSDDTPEIEIGVVPFSSPPPDDAHKLASMLEQFTTMKR